MLLVKTQSTDPNPAFMQWASIHPSIHTTYSNTHLPNHSHQLPRETLTGSHLPMWRLSRLQNRAISPRATMLLVIEKKNGQVGEKMNLSVTNAEAQQQKKKEKDAQSTWDAAVKPAVERAYSLLPDSTPAHQARHSEGTDTDPHYVWLWIWLLKWRHHGVPLGRKCWKRQNINMNVVEQPAALPVQHRANIKYQKGLL